MPSLQIDTNLPKEAFPEDFLTTVSEGLSKLLGKPLKVCHGSFLVCHSMIGLYKCIFDQNLDQVSHESKEILLLGDMHTDLLKTSGSVQNKLLHILEDASLTQVITTPTRVCSSSKTKSLIDHVYVSSPDSIVNSCVPHYAIMHK